MDDDLVSSNTLQGIAIKKLSEENDNLWEGLLSGNVVNKNESNYIIMIEQKDCYIETVLQRCTKGT